MPLPPQAALETAVLNAIRTAIPSYVARNSGRQKGPRPPASAPTGELWLSVWHDGSLPASPRGALDLVHGVNVTLSVRVHLPPDRDVAHRDELHARVAAVVALVHKDHRDFSIVNAAAVLADFDTGPTKPIGWREGLHFAGVDPVQEVGGEWYGADPAEPLAALAQTARFTGARRIQATGTAT